MGKGEIAHYEQFLLFPQCFQKTCTADDNFEFNENGRKISKRVENNGKRRNCSLQAISPSLTVFSKDSQRRHVKTRACLGKGK